MTRNWEANMLFKRKSKEEMIKEFNKRYDAYKYGERDWKLFYEGQERIKRYKEEQRIALHKYGVIR